jgi:hypothetical protein
MLNLRMLYRVILKSVKHFKNSQQIDYATDHDNSYADRETLEVFFKEKPGAHSCPDLPLGDSSSRYGVQHFLFCFGICKNLIRCDCPSGKSGQICARASP